MKNDFFESMKEQMKPDSAVMASLKYRMKAEKHVSAAGYAFRWVPTAISVLAAALLVFNMTMPAAAEQLPVVGKAFESLNDTGKEARAEGKTPAFLLPEEDEKPFSLTVSLGECDGLDLTFLVEVSDISGTVTDKSDILTLTDVCVEAEGMYLYPTDEAPRLMRVDEGLFRGEAVFNAAPVASALSEGEESAWLYCESLTAYVEGATYEEVISLYTYELAAAVEFPFEVDLSELEIEYLGIENEGIMIDQVLKSPGRTDVVFSVSEDVEYARSFSIYTDNAAPSVTRMRAAKDENGRYVYTATFDDGESLKLEDAEGEGAVLVEAPFYIYSNATGEYMIIEDKYEAEPEVVE